MLRDCKATRQLSELTEICGEPVRKISREMARWKIESEGHAAHSQRSAVAGATRETRQVGNQSAPRAAAFSRSLQILGFIFGEPAAG